MFYSNGIIIIIIIMVIQANIKVANCEGTCYTYF